MAGFIFGGNTPWTYDELKRQREIATALAMNAPAPSNVGEGLTAIGNALAYRGITKRANKEEARLKGEFDSKMASAFGGGMAAPSGSSFTPSGPALPPPDPNSPHALGDAAMAALGKPAVKTGADPASIKAGLVARGLPEHIADGFVMNMQDESGLNPGINEVAPLVPGSRGGFGLYQLTGPRRKAYEAYAAQKGVPLDDVDAQLDFLMMELQGPEAEAWSKISGAQNAGEAGAAIVNHFLRPAEEHRAARSAEYLGGAPASPGGMDLGSLVALAGDPMISPAQKAIVEQLIAQQTQAADPMQAIELEKARLELEAMKNPSAKSVELETFNGPDGRVYSFNPATGETTPLTDAEQPEPGYAVMTPEEVQALGLPPGAYQKGPKGEIKEIGGGGVNVSVGAGETSFDKAAGEAAAKSYSTIQDEGISAATGIATLDAMESSMADPNFYSGTGAGAVEAMRRAAVSIGIADPSSVTSMESFGSLAKGAALSAMGGSLGAGFSNADRDFVEKQVPTLGNTPEGNREIIRIQKSILKRKQELADLAANYAAEREAEGKRFDQAGFQKRAKEYAEANPLFGKPAEKEGASGIPEGIDPADWEFMTPEERALFQ